MTSLQAVGKNYRLKGKEIATSLTSTTNIINNINNKHNNNIINNISVQSLPLLEEISGVSKYHSGHLPSQSAANSTKRSKLLRNCLFRAQQANKYMRFPTNCYVGFSSFSNCEIYTKDNRVYYIYAVLYCLVLSVSKLQVNYSSHITPSLSLSFR